MRESWHEWCWRVLRVRRDYVKKIAVYKDKLAVQLPSKIVIYELRNSCERVALRMPHDEEHAAREGGVLAALRSTKAQLWQDSEAFGSLKLTENLTIAGPWHSALCAADENDMHYQSATKIQQKLECNLLVVTSCHVILCQVRRPTPAVSASSALARHALRDQGAGAMRWGMMAVAGPDAATRPCGATSQIRCSRHHAPLASGKSSWPHPGAPVRWWWVNERRRRSCSSTALTASRSASG